MSSAGDSQPPVFSPSVFLSYASEDRVAARAIRDALAAEGIEVWYDENELGGGDAWDQKIRKQIRDCVYFMPVISARTEARHEGYFRREWRLAVDRSHDMADDVLFLLPVVIDSTDQATARVPERFLTVQWLKVPGGTPTPALLALCKRLVAGRAVSIPAPRRVAPTSGGKAAPPPPPSLPVFPHEEPGQKLRFFALVIGWACQTAWITFKRMPRFLRAIIILFLFLSLLSRCSSDKTVTHTSAPRGLTAAQKAKIEAITKQATNISSVEDLTKIANAALKEAGASAQRTTNLLVIPFAAAPDDPDGREYANAVFTQVVGQLIPAHPGEIAVSPDLLSGVDLADSAKAQARDKHSRQVLFGSIEGSGPLRQLQIKFIDVNDDDSNWMKAYAINSKTPAEIAAIIAGQLSDLDN